jgi:hypothetical protein
MGAAATYFVARSAALIGVTSTLNELAAISGLVLTRARTSDVTGVTRLPERRSLAVPAV